MRHEYTVYLISRHVIKCNDTRTPLFADKRGRSALAIIGPDMLASVGTVGYA